MVEDSVTIIIPTYKGASTVRLTVLSALNQENVTNLEVIVVDDNGVGTDRQKETEKVLLDLINSQKIKYLCHEINSGGSAARNTGLQASHGDYICFIDDDDYIFPNKTAEQLAVLRNTGKNVAMCVSTEYSVNPDGVGVTRSIESDLTDDFLYNYLIGSNFFNTSAILLKTAIVKEFNGFDETFIRHQDWEFCSRILSKYDAVVVNKPLMIRYLENRNTPTDLRVAKKYMDYYMMKMEPFWKKRLSDKQIRKVKSLRNEIFVRYYLTTGRVKEAISLMDSYANFKTEIFVIVFRAIKDKLRIRFIKEKKIVKSRIELEDTLERNYR